MNPRPRAQGRAYARAPAPRGQRAPSRASGLGTYRNNVFRTPRKSPGGVDKSAPRKAAVTRRRALVLALSEAAKDDPTLSGEERGLFTQIAFALDSCGSWSLPSTEGDGKARVVVRENEAGHRHIAGAMHCGKHLCPLCSPFNARRRQDALLELVPLIADKGRHFHVVLTLRHHKGVRWRDLVACFRKVWRRQQQRRYWKDVALGFVRADEVTEGRAGTHHHIHLLLTLKPDVDADAVKTWFQAFWEEQARKEGRTADWSAMEGRWWTEIHGLAQLKSTLKYASKLANKQADVASTPLGHTLAAEVMGGTAKVGSTPWDLPLRVYAEVWRDSKGHRWFATGGLWKTTKTEEVEDDEEATQQRETVGVEIVDVEGEDWDHLAHPRYQEQRHMVSGYVYNKDVTQAEFLRFWRAFWPLFREMYAADHPTKAESPPGSGDTRHGQQESSGHHRQLGEGPGSSLHDVWQGGMHVHGGDQPHMEG